MADEADFAFELQSQEIQMACAANARAAAKAVLPATGKCLFCDEPLEPGHRFCDEDCATGWEREQRGTALAKGPAAAHAAAFGNRMLVSQTKRASHPSA